MLEIHIIYIFYVNVIRLILIILLCGNIYKIIMEKKSYFSKTNKTKRVYVIFIFINSFNSWQLAFHLLNHSQI